MMPVGSRIRLKTSGYGLSSPVGKAHNFRREDFPVEVYRLTVRAIGVTPKPSFPKIAIDPDAKAVPKGTREALFHDHPEPMTTALYDRESLPAGVTIKGPAIIDQLDSTTVRRTIRSPSDADSVCPVCANPSRSRSIQIRPSGFSITSTMSGSRKRAEMAGPSAVRSMRTPRSTTAVFWSGPAIPSPVPPGR